MNSTRYQYRPLINLISGPVGAFLFYILAFSFTSDEPMSRTIGLAAWMVIWWITEAVPLPVTALLPLIFLPLANISSIAEAASSYANPVIFLFMGGFMLALALQKHRLHERIALNILRFTGTSGNGIILGFTIATAVLSMWVSNTATAVMMLPIAISVTDLLLSDSRLSSDERKFALGLMLSIAYAANIGGFMTIIGTPPNVVMVGYLDTLVNYEMTFSRWLLVGIPCGITMLALVYLLTTRLLIRNNLKSVDGSKQLVDEKLTELGPVGKDEKLVIAIFGLTVFAWMFKGQINDLLGANLLTDHVTAMAGGTAMFVIPSGINPIRTLLDWEDTRNLPWGILLLFGGGISLAAAMEKVGIIDHIGDFVAGYGHINKILLVLIVTGIVLFMTELMSNVALVTIMLPVLIAVAAGMGENPLLLVIPATMASSCAFMMPISTPPNAIVYSSGYIRIKDMMRAGFILNILAVFILTIFTYYLVPFLL